jgi:hypothetical protein
MNQSVYDQLREIEDKYVKVTEIETVCYRTVGLCLGVVF